MQIIGIFIQNGDKRVLKNLRENTWYPFGNFEDCHEIFADSIKYKKNLEVIKENQNFCEELYRINDLEKFSPVIHLNCIVGKNGSGKSSILEIFYAIINNFNCAINEIEPNKCFSPNFAYGFNAELYFELENELGCIKICNNEKFEPAKNFKIFSSVFFFYKTEINISECITFDKVKNNIFSHFFYTVATNYSFYSYAGKNVFWIDNLFQKNDGYLTPIVLVPYRYNNSIEYTKEYLLAQERIKIFSILLSVSDNENLIENYVPYKIYYSLGDYKIELLAKIYGLKTGQDVYISPFDEDKVDSILNDSFFKNIHNEWKKRLEDKGIKILDNSAHDATILYLCYKTIKIFKNFGTLLFKKNISLEKDYAYIILQLSDESKINHINLKIVQCINFLRDNFFVVDNDKEHSLLVSKFIKKIKEKNEPYTYDNIFIHMPPAFFKVDIEYKNLISKSTMNLCDLSSGEEHLLFLLSYFVYHIKNIESIQNDDSRIFYRNINLILDEAELYYHPEFQRVFISKFLDVLKKCHFKKIESINITIVTHSPFMLTDVPATNILCLENGLPVTKVYRTLGANIYDLLKNQFFMDSSIGEVSIKIINRIIIAYENYKDKGEKIEEKSMRFYRVFAGELGDEYLKNTLSAMLDIVEGTSPIEIKKNEYINKLKYLDSLKADLID